MLIPALLVGSGGQEPSEVLLESSDRYRNDGRAARGPHQSAGGGFGRRRALGL